MGVHLPSASMNRKLGLFSTAAAARDNIIGTMCTNNMAERLWITESGRLSSNRLPVTCQVTVKNHWSICFFKQKMTPGGSRGSICPQSVRLQEFKKSREVARVVVYIWSRTSLHYRYLYLYSLRIQVQYIFLSPPPPPLS